MQVQQLIQDDLNKRSTKHANKSTLVTRGADTQLGSRCVSAPLATNVDLWNPLTDYILFIIMKHIFVVFVCVLYQGLDNNLESQKYLTKY